MGLEKLIVSFGFLASASLFADGAAVWGGEQLHNATGAALERLQEVEGAEAYAAVSSLSVKRNAQGNAARAEIIFVKQGVSKTVSYFCHTHENDVDCH